HPERRRQLAPLLHELAPDRRQPLVLQPDGPPVAAEPSLVACGGGAVLCDLAAPARAGPRARRPETAALRRRAGDRRLSRAHVAPLQPDRSVSRLVRDGHARILAAYGDPAR